MQTSSPPVGALTPNLTWAREPPNLSLDDALQLVHLYAERGSPKYERAALRWLKRYLAEGSPKLQHFAAQDTRRDRLTPGNARMCRRPREGRGVMQRDKPSAQDVLDGPLWASVRGAGSPTVVFEAGGGEDSSVWSEMEPEVRDRCEVRTMLYDRAGLGRSPPSSPPYRIDREADALRLELDRRGITTPVVLVAHSYGGFVATILAATDPRIAAVVLVDANLAGFFDDEQIERLLATYRPQFPALEQAAPALAGVMIPVIEAYPATVARLRQIDIPAATPTIDIVAERTWVETPEEIEAIREAHRVFVAASSHRRAVFAEGSGHHIMRDRPEVVLDAIAEVVAAVRARPTVV